MQILEMEDEVVQFVTTESNYMAFTSQGRRLDILKSASLQPEIEDQENYFTYLWVKAMQGYFLLRQHIVESVSGPWFVIREVVPDEDLHFFEDYRDEVLSTL